MHAEQKFSLAKHVNQLYTNRKSIWNNMKRKVYPIAIILLFLYALSSIVLMLFSQDAEQLKRDKSITAIYTVLCNILVAAFFTFFIARQKDTISKKQSVIIDVISKFESVFFSSFSSNGAVDSISTADIWAIFKRLYILLDILDDAVPEVCNDQISADLQRVRSYLGNIQYIIDNSKQEYHKLPEFIIDLYLADYENMQNIIDQIKAKIIFDC